MEIPASNSVGFGVLMGWVTYLHKLRAGGPSNIAVDLFMKTILISITNSFVY